jgi:hypothetical protein
MNIALPTVLLAFSLHLLNYFLDRLSKRRGMADCKRFEAYHRLLNRDKWDPLNGAKILLGLLIVLVTSSLPLIIVVDDTIERRKGKKIKAKG